MTPLPKPKRIPTHGYNTVAAYTAAQLQAYGEACRKEAIAECLEITRQWGPLGDHFAQTLKELK